MIGDVNRANKRENLPRNFTERDVEVEDYLFQRQLDEYLAAREAQEALDGHPES